MIGHLRLKSIVLVHFSEIVCIDECLCELVGIDLNFMRYNFLMYDLRASSNQVLISNSTRHPLYDITLNAEIF